MSEDSKRRKRRVRLPAILLAALLLTAVGVGIVSAQPIVSSITPNIALQGATVPVAITGDGFLEGATVELDYEAQGIQATEIKVISPTQITCTFAISTVETIGEWTVFVTNPDRSVGRLDGGFTIISGGPPSVTYIAPNSGQAGSTVVITTLGGVEILEGATVQLIRTGSAPIIATKVVPTWWSHLSCEFALPSDAATGAWDVTVTNPDGQSGTLPSGFTITPAATPAITVTAPNGGERLNQGSIQTITWSTVGTTGSYVKIELMKGMSVNSIISSSTTNDGSFSWTVPATQTVGTDYRIRITSTGRRAYSDTSNAYFSIVAPMTGITVTAPNGGEIWMHGTVHTISWTSEGAVGPYVKIELLKGTAVNRIVSSRTANDGSFRWIVPAAKMLGADYRIRITTTGKVGYTDSSNAYFRIT